MEKKSFSGPFLMPPPPSEMKKTDFIVHRSIKKKRRLKIRDKGARQDFLCVTLTHISPSLCTFNFFPFGAQSQIGTLQRITACLLCQPQSLSLLLLLQFFNNAEVS